MVNPRKALLKSAVAATRAFCESDAATGSNSEETEKCRDACDDLFWQLSNAEQVQVRKLERKLRKGLLSPDGA